MWEDFEKKGLACKSAGPEQKIYRDHKARNCHAENISLHHLGKDVLGEMNSILRKKSTCQMFLFTPQSGVRKCLSQKDFSVGSVLCINMMRDPARNSSNTDSCFPPFQCPAKLWVLLLQLWYTRNTQQKALF